MTIYTSDRDRVDDPLSGEMFSLSFIFLIISKDNLFI